MSLGYQIKHLNAYCRCVLHHGTEALQELAQKRNFQVLGKRPQGSLGTK